MLGLENPWRPVQIKYVATHNYGALLATGYNITCFPIVSAFVSKQKSVHVIPSSEQAGKQHLHELASKHVFILLKKLVVCCEICYGYWSLVLLMFRP